MAGDLVFFINCWHRRPVVIYSIK